MSQDASTPRRLLKPSDASPFSSESFDATQASSFPVESYADRLMDDLFGDVERLLDSNTTPLTEPVRSEPPTPSPKAAALSGLVDLVSPLIRRSDVESLAPDEQDADGLLANRDAEPSLTPKPSIESVSQSESKAGRSYDRLLLGVGCLSIIATLGVWLLNQQASRPPVPAVPLQTNADTTNSGNSTADDSFVNYLQQALKAIDQRQAGAAPVGSNGTSTSLPIVQPGSPTIQTPAPGTTPGTTNRPATGLSRLYVPVYQVPQPQPGRPSVAPLPSASAPTTVRPPIPLSMPGIPKKLLGVYEQGDRSAALIEINGVTQRYGLGESIGTSGWTLVEVAKDQAVIRRNGEVRSVFIGQNF